MHFTLIYVSICLVVEYNNVDDSDHAVFLFADMSKKVKVRLPEIATNQNERSRNLSFASFDISVLQNEGLASYA